MEDDDMRRATYHSIRLIVCFVFMLLLASAASAQFRAAVQGNVTDNAGAVVSGASVTLTNRDTGQTQQTITSDDGFYRFSGLAPGFYTITVEKSNFKKKTVEDVKVDAETLRGVDVVLEAGTITEVVVVEAENAPLETEDANVRKVISNEEILRLPQVGRDPYELARLAPGVFGAGARTGTGGAANLPNTSGPGGSTVGIFQTENQVPISANGQRVSANNFQIDGTSVNSQTWGGAAVITPSQESVKEVQVTSSTYSAEDGRNSGAQIKVVTQNGTNVFRGSAFFKYNDPGWNAFNRFYGIPGVRPSTPQRVEIRDKTFGGSLGGRIIRDELFFFFSYEGLRNRTNNVREAFIETPQLRQLIRSARPNGIAATILGQPGIEPRAISIIPRTCADFNFPVPSCAVVAGGFDLGSPAGMRGQYVPFSQPLGGGLDGIPDVQYALLENPTSFKGNQFFTRFDYNATNKDNFAVSLFITPTEVFTPDAAGQSRPMNDIRSERLNWALGAIYTRTFSARILNEARFNVTRWGFDEVSSNPDTNFGIPRIEIEGFLPGGDRLRFGAPRGENTPGVIEERQFDFRNILTWMAGNQTFKFGGEYRLDLNENTGTGGARPLFSFVRPWNFANDTPIFEAINADAFGNPQANNAPFRGHNFAFFVQDDWKVRPNLTLNLGLRWEYLGPIRSENIGNLEFGPGGLADARVVTGDQLTDSDWNNFGPQLGFAWSPKWFNDKLVIRGGAGIGYDRLPNALLANTRANPPYGARYNICCGGAGAAGGEEWAPPFANGQILYALGSSNSPLSYPRNPVLGGGINPATGAPRVGAIEIYGAERELKNSEVYRYSLEGQYEFPFKLVGTLGYQGSQSRNFVRIAPEHLVQPTTNPSFFAVFFGHGDVSGNYNAMNARLRRRFANDFQFDFNYRFSKSIDTYSFEAPCACTNQTFPVDQDEERGPSDYDVRHFWTLSGLWDVPFFRNQKNWVSKLLGGWQISGIWTRHTGFPWTPKVGQGLRGPSGNFFGPIRPVAYNGTVPAGNSNSSFLQRGGVFPGSFVGGNCGAPPGCNNVFATYVFGNPPDFRQNPPGIGRNVFYGPKYSSVDLSLVKRFGLPDLGFWGERAKLDLRFNFFNLFNNLNLTGPQVFVNEPNFGEATGALAGRVIEFQMRFSF
jgi:hypothetical protein